MKIGPKLAICFVAAAVLPLAAASAVYLRSSVQVGHDLTEQGKAVLAERVTGDLRRTIEQGGVAIEVGREEIAKGVRFLASDIASRYGSTPSGADAPNAVNDKIVPADGVTENGANPRIDLQRMSADIANDAARDEIAGTLTRLAAAVEPARSIYLRNRALISHITIALENGLSLTYPGGAPQPSGDPRERSWYLETLENAALSWFGPTEDDAKTLTSATPVQLSDGRLVGVVAVSVRIDALLVRSLGPANISASSTARLIVVPRDDPALSPHIIGTLSSEDAAWKLNEVPLPVSLDGDDAWLKLVSDIRSGVPGLEYVKRSGEAEVWAFGPVGRTEDGVWSLAVAAPQQVIDAVSARAEQTVRDAFSSQLKYAVSFSVVAAGLAALFGIYGARTLTRPIRSLFEASERLARGDFSVRVENAGSGELEALARGFNRMVPALEQQLKTKRDLNVAREIQQHLVPQGAPSIDGFDVAAITEYCDETGGDYQDFIPLDDEAWAVVLGDVTGHGVGAALMMASARATLRANARHTDRPDLLLDATNGHLAADSTGGRFMTLFFIRLTRDRSRFEWVSAGHEAALLYDPAADTFTVLEGDGIPLGVDAEWHYGTSEASFATGQILIAYTDGVRESKRADGEAFGLTRLKDVVRENRERGSRTICEKVVEALHAFTADTKIVDDVSVLVVRPTDGSQ